jgi:hypothetical protein
MSKRRFWASSRLWYSGLSASAKRRSDAARLVNASARSRRRSVASVRCPAARRASRCAIRSLLMSRTACSTAGQFSSWAGVSFSAALSAAMRASVNAAISSAVSCARCDRRSRRGHLGAADRRCREHHQAPFARRAGRTRHHHGLSTKGRAHSVRAVWLRRTS